MRLNILCCLVFSGVVAGWSGVGDIYDINGVRRRPTAVGIVMKVLQREGWENPQIKEFIAIGVNKTTPSANTARQTLIARHNQSLSPAAAASAATAEAVAPTSPHRPAPAHRPSPATSASAAAAAAYSPGSSPRGGASPLSEEEDSGQEETDDETLARRLQEEEYAAAAEGGAAGAAAAPPAPPSRDAAEWLRNSALIPIEGRTGDTGVDIGIINGRTAQYGPAYFPKVPFFHPYNPSDIAGKKGYHTTVCFILAQLPTHIFTTRLPPFIQRAAPHVTEIYLEVQSNPWTAKSVILSRPHYWVDPNAPYVGRHKVSTTVKQQCFWPDGKLFYNASVAAHNHPGEGNRIIASPNANAIRPLTQPEKSFSFWSVTTHKKRQAVTLHLFIAPDLVIPLQHVIRRIVASPHNNMQELLDRLNHLPDVPADFIEALDQLFR